MPHPGTQTESSNAQFYGHVNEIRAAGSYGALASFRFPGRPGTRLAAPMRTNIAPPNDSSRQGMSVSRGVLLVRGAGKSSVSTVLRLLSSCVVLRAKGQAETNQSGGWVPSDERLKLLKSAERKFVVACIPNIKEIKIHDGSNIVV